MNRRAIRETPAEAGFSRRPFGSPGIYARAGRSVTDSQNRGHRVLCSDLRPSPAVRFSFLLGAEPSFSILGRDHRPGVILLAGKVVDTLSSDQGNVSLDDTIGRRRCASLRTLSWCRL